MNPTPADGLLLELYACCADATRWAGVLDRLCAEVGARSVVVQGLSRCGERVQPFWIAHDSGTDVSQYEAVISDAGNPRLESKRVPSVLGRLLRDEDLFPGDERPIQQRLEQQLSQIGLGRFLGGLMPLGSDQFVGIALHRAPHDDGDFSPRQLDRLTALLPHVAQAVSLGQSMVATQRTEALLRGHLDRWHGGLIVCEADGRVQWLNRRARVQLEAGQGLHWRDGRLRAATPLGQQRLLRALSAQAGDTTPGFLALEQGGRRWHLALQALDVPADGHAAPLLLTLTGDAPGGVIPAPALATLFALTDAESRLASALVGGDTLEQYAQRRGVAVGTVRYQLKQVLAKTGASRQSDLVRRVLCSAAAHAAGLHADTRAAAH